jgi:hypothetical protein
MIKDRFKKKVDLAAFIRMSAKGARKVYNSLILKMKDESLMMNEGMMNEGMKE